MYGGCGGVSKIFAADSATFLTPNGEIIMDDNAKNTATFLGYEEIELKREINGKKSVQVKCLPVRKFAEYAALFTLEPEMAGLCTDLTPAEVDMLSAEDSGRIFEKAHELNFAPFSAWLGRKTKAAEMIAQAYGASLPQKESNPKGEDSANSPLGL